MMSLFRILFPSKEVRIVLDAVGKLLTEIEGELSAEGTNTFSEYHALNETKSSLQSYTKRKYIRAAYLLREEGVSAEQIALDFTCKCVSDSLESGKFTSYTHELTYVGKGVYKIYVSLMAKYEANGIQTPQQSEVLLKQMKEKIRSAPYKSSTFLHPKY